MILVNLLLHPSNVTCRYHSLFHDTVPDLQPVEPSKRHTFFGYHTSVFRG